MDKKRDPEFKLGSSVKVGQPTKVTITSAKPLSSGTNKYGEWELWVLEVENARVIDKDSGKNIDGYTGKATFFAKGNSAKKFAELTGGVKKGCVVEISVEPKQRSDGGFYSEYSYKLLKDGEVSSSSISYSQNQYLVDFEECIQMGVTEDDREVFFTLGKQKPYVLSEQKLEELWTFHRGSLSQVVQ